MIPLFVNLNSPLKAFLYEVNYSQTALTKEKEDKQTQLQSRKIPKTAVNRIKQKTTPLVVCHKCPTAVLFNIILGAVLCLIECLIERNGLILI